MRSMEGEFDDINNDRWVASIVVAVEVDSSVCAIAAAADASHKLRTPLRLSTCAFAVPTRD